MGGHYMIPRPCHTPRNSTGALIWLNEATFTFNQVSVCFLGISQTAAMRIKLKIQMVMKFSDDSKRLGDFVQVDDVYWGAKHSGGKRGRDAEGKTILD